jgi:hypothetical protein
MTLSLQARIIALAGAAVVLAVGLFAALVAPALATFERAIALEQSQARAVVADSIARYAFARPVDVAQATADPELTALLQPLRGASSRAALVDDRGRLIAGDATGTSGDATHVPGTPWAIRV